MHCAKLWQAFTIDAISLITPIALGRDTAIQRCVLCDGCEFFSRIFSVIVKLPDLFEDEGFQDAEFAPLVEHPQGAVGVGVGVVVGVEHHAAVLLLFKSDVKGEDSGGWTLSVFCAAFFEAFLQR